ncbi:hypothetical protein HPB50_025251 [Hyalomma asiaticum]|uniref:Uncharacterized protein n=1 Tax=Hyalomma asiaticum TaxID=266040 RepID=A0ACB7SFS0_HYAAI|nr:hypothetical protein HPB50_025251 [Hyalomma asiaticum]
MGRADELKLEIEALKLQLEVEKLKTARFLQKAVQARSETSGLGRYAKDLKAVLVPMPADDTMVPAWFKMAEMLLKMLGVPEEMQGTLVLPFLTEKVRTSLSGTCSYEELKEKVLRELKPTLTEYRRCFPEIKREVREQSCDGTKLMGSFGKAVTTELVCVPLGLTCPSGNTQRVSLPCAVTPELTTSAEVLLNPGDYDSHCLGRSRSEPTLEGSNCGLVERSTEQDVVVTSRNEVDSAAPICDEDIARDAVGEEPNQGGKENMCLGATLEPTHESEKEVGVEMSVRGEANPDLGYREQASAAVGAAGDPAQACRLIEKEWPIPCGANAFAEERVHEKSSAEAQHAFDMVGEAVASMQTLAAPCSWSAKPIGHCPKRDEDGDERLVAVLSREQVPTHEKQSAAERGSFAAVWTKETFGRWIFGIKVRIKTDDGPLTFLTRSAPLSGSPACQACKWQMW